MKGRLLEPIAGQFLMDFRRTREGRDQHAGAKAGRESARK